MNRPLMTRQSVQLFSPSPLLRSVRRRANLEAVPPCRADALKRLIERESGNRVSRYIKSAARKFIIISVRWRAGSALWRVRGRVSRPSGETRRKQRARARRHKTPVRRTPVGFMRRRRASRRRGTDAARFLAPAICFYEEERHLMAANGAHYSGAPALAGCVMRRADRSFHPRANCFRAGWCCLVFLLSSARSFSCGPP